MKKYLVILWVFSCVENIAAAQTTKFFKGADISWLQEVETSGAIFREGGNAKDPLIILKNHGFNYIRLRIWHTPKFGINGLDSTLKMATRVKNAGLKLLLDFHFSDWWADPGKQIKPAAWNELSYNVLKDSVHQYVHAVFAALKAQGTLPDMVQFGNEIIGGMLWPEGDIRGDSNTVQQWIHFTDLLKAADQGMSEVLSPSEIVTRMVHIDRGGDYNACAWFFDKLFSYNVPCDIIGLSYYPWWHGSLANMSLNITNLEARYNKDIVLAEIAYPFTLQNNDKGGNIVSSPTQLLSGYPATVDGQGLFLSDVLKSVKNVPNNHGRGVFYWEPDALSSELWQSGWENLSLFSFFGEVLTSITAFEDAPAKVNELDAKKQNFLSVTASPNPFNLSTIIRFTIPQSGLTTLQVYDVVGREVATVMKEYLIAGENYQRMFDASNLGSGIYFYTLQTPNYSVTKKIALIK